jgi:hypothetical protein
VDLITKKFKVFDSAETGHIDKEEWYAMLSGVIDFTDIFDVIKLLEEQNTANHSNPQSLTNTPIDRISLSDLFEALYACPRTRIKLEFGSGMYQNRGQARAALIQKRAKQSEEKEKQVAIEREQANIQSHLPSIHPSNPLNTSNPDSTVTNSTAFTPNVNANVNTSKSIIGNRKRGKQKSMSIAAPVNTSSSFSAGYDRESTISELTEVKTSDLGFSSPPTSSSSRSSNTAEELNVSENRGRHVSTGEKNAEIKEAAAAAAAATLHATSLEMSSLSSSFPFFVSQSAILPISNVNSPRNNDPSPLETIHPDTTSRNNTPPSINPQSTTDEPRTATKTPRVVMILGENNDGSIYWEIHLKEDNSCNAFFLLENSGIHYKTRNEIFEQTKGNDVYVNFSLGLKSLRKRVEQKIKEEGFHVVEGQEYLQDPPQGQFAQQLSGEASKVSASRRRQTSKRNSYVSSTSRISMRVQNEARSLERAGTIVRASATSMAFLSMLNERLMFKRYKEQCMLNSLGTSTKDQQSLFASMNCEDGPQNPQTSTSRSNNPYPQRHTSTVVETALQGMASNLSLNHARVFAKRLSIQKPLPELPPNYKELSSISEQNDTSWIQELSRVRLDQSTTLTSSPTYSSFIRRKNSTVNVAFGTTLERKQTRVFTKMDTFSGQKQVDHQKRQSNFSSSSSSSTSQLPTVQKRPSSLAPLNS